MRLRAHHAIPITLLYGLGYPLGALALGELAAPWVLTIRFVAAAALLALVAVLTGRRWPRGRQWGHVIVVGILTQAVQFGFAYEGMRLGVAPTLTALVIAMNPVVTTVLAGLWLGERPTRRGIAGLVLGLVAIGVAFAGRVSADGIDAAVLFTLLALLGMSAGGVYQQRFLPTIDPLPASAVGQFVSAIPMAIWAALTPPSLGDPGRAAASMAAMVILSAAVGTTVYMAAVRRSGAARVSLLFAVIPSVAALFGWILLAQLPSPGVLAGLVIGAIACIVGGSGTHSSSGGPSSPSGEPLRNRDRVRQLSPKGG
ncbi:DMT family transporter [Arthrobacter sp. NPDC090010]|uniref:DMT family transporter n=1 Tax=Arthrobacter sp. NPDC090010 TaxID=3363942 RepID=UPI003822DC04